MLHQAMALSLKITKTAFWIDALEVISSSGADFPFYFLMSLINNQLCR